MNQEQKMLPLLIWHHQILIRLAREGNQVCYSYKSPSGGISLYFGEHYLNMLQAQHMFLLSVDWMKMLMRKCYAMNFLNMPLLRFEINSLAFLCGVWLLVCYFVLTINTLYFQDLRLVRDKFTHVSRGFAFIHFYSVSFTFVLPWRAHC